MKILILTINIIADVVYLDTKIRSADRLVLFSQDVNMDKKQNCNVYHIQFISICACKSELYFDIKSFLISHHVVIIPYTPYTCNLMCISVNIVRKST